MRGGDSISTVTSAVYHAKIEDLTDIEYDATPRFLKLQEGAKSEIKKRRPREEELDVYHFSQMWSSTSLGFGGAGGASMTTAYTTVVHCKQIQEICVYFDGRLAYNIDVSNAEVYTAVMERIKEFNMPDVRKAQEIFSV